MAWRIEALNNCFLNSITFITLLALVSKIITAFKSQKTDMQFPYEIRFIDRFKGLSINLNKAIQTKPSTQRVCFQILRFIL